MRSRAMSMILIVSAAACAPSAPSTRPSPNAPPVRALLSERDRLSLSSEQVVALDSISRKLDVADRASHRRGSIKRVLAAHVGSAKQPDRALALVAGSHRSAMQAVEQLLRPDQRQRLCDLQREREATAALQQDKRAPAGHSLASSGARRSEKRRGWPWCSSGPSRASTAAQSES